MGHMKEWAIKQDGLRDIAKALLHRIGIIDVCDGCGYYCSMRELTNDDYAIITSIAKKEYNLKDGDFKDFHAVIKAVYDESGVETIKEHLEISH